MTKKSKGRSRYDPGALAPLSAPPFMAHGWAVYLAKEFIEQVDRLADAVQTTRRQRGEIVGVDKVFAAVMGLAFDIIPSDPTRPEYRLGSALGSRSKHWFRAKFGNGRFRLFFRYRADARIIVFGWVNDEKSLRTYGSHTDAYAAVGRMLDAGHPPDSWEDLLREASSQAVVDAARAVLDRTRNPDG